MRFITNSSLTPILVLLWLNINAQTDVEVNFSVKHQVDSISTFEREKFITIHADQAENEWIGDNQSLDLLDDFLNGYNVYMGRNTGGISWYVNQIKEDPDRPGHVDLSDLSRWAGQARNNYSSKSGIQAYESRNNLIIAAQLHPFWTGASQRPTGQGWSFIDATATGEYMGKYINEFHSQNGPPKPSFIEVINEPAFEALGGFYDTNNSIDEIAQFHVEVADAIRKEVSDIPIGGYTTAFPNFSFGNFKRWNNRWKRFMDIAGDKMDFWSLHLYDFPVFNGNNLTRSGSHVEATFDMIDQYSMLLYGRTKPYVISEYGASSHEYFNEQWSPFRDWLHIKAQNSLLMSFLERPSSIDIAMNFLIVKAEWGYHNGIPYNHRLMRKENEPISYSGQWVYTDMVKFYELWENVEGTRVFIKADDPDIQANAYVDENKAFVILNSLESSPNIVNLNHFGLMDQDVLSVNTKHLTLKDNVPFIDTQQFSQLPPTIELGPESTMILEYEFDDFIIISDSTIEKKYFSDAYLQEIESNNEIIFNISDVETSEYGTGKLRLGIGRDHGKSLTPIISFNDHVISIPDDWRGYDQSDWPQYFGVIEIPVDNDIIENENKIKIKFSDSGGYVSTVSMQVYNHSSDFLNTSTSIKVDSDLTVGVSIYPNPAKNEINVRLQDVPDNGKFSLMDLQGRILIQQPIISVNNTLDVSRLPDGMYIFSISDRYKEIYKQKIFIKE